MVFGGGSRRLEVLLELRDKFSAGMKQASSGLDKFNDSLKKARPVLLGITAAVGGVGVLSVKAASDLEEAQNRVNEIFGASANIVRKFAREQAAAFNLSRRAANQYTGELGAILTASGLSSDAAAGMSITMTKLAADLSSFANIPIAEALQKIRSGLVGQAEPLRTVGVLLSETAVQAKAMELGLANASGELTEGAKVQARYALILQQTAPAQGDVARTAGTLANQMRGVQQATEDASASIGVALIPVTTKAVHAVNSLVQQVAALPSGLQTAGIAIAGATGGLAALGLVIPPLVTGVSSLGKVMTATGTAMKALIPVLAGVNASMLGVVGVIGAIAIAGSLLWALFRTSEESDKVAVSQDKLVASMRRLQSAAGGAGEALGDTDAAVAAIRESLASAGQEVTIFGANNETVWTRNQETVAQAAKDMVAVVEQYGITLDKLQPALEGLGLSHEQLAPLIEAASANTARLNDQNKILQTTFEATADAAAAQGRDVGNLDQKLRDFSQTARNTTFLQDQLMALFAKSAEQVRIYEGVASLAAESVWNIGMAAKDSAIPGLEELRDAMALDSEEAERFGRVAREEFESARQKILEIRDAARESTGFISGMVAGTQGIFGFAGTPTLHRGSAFDVPPLPWDVATMGLPPPGIPIVPINVPPVQPAAPTPRIIENVEVHFNGPVFGMNDFDDKVVQAMNAARRRGAA